MMLTNTFALPAFAKINWMLRVFGRRPDNLHEIETVLQTINLHDLLIFEDRADERIELTCNAPDIPLDGSNLIYRAAIALCEKYKIKRGVRIHLEKRIPAGGGLGGGSSDAAVALLGLSHLWNLPATKAELIEIGAKIGADVPFFFTGGTARGVGLGTDIEALPEITVPHLLIVTPNVAVSTAKAYAMLNRDVLTKANLPDILPSSRRAVINRNTLESSIANDFELAVFSLQPVIEQARNTLNEFGASVASLSGSGASVFGIFDNQEQQERAEKRLRAQTVWQVFACRTLSRTEYKQAFGRCGALRSG